jgi:hypothetical protein
VDGPSIVFDHGTPFSHPNVIRMRDRNFSSAAQLNPERLERNLTHRLSKFVQHN